MWKERMLLRPLFHVACGSIVVFFVAFIAAGGSFSSVKQPILKSESYCSGPYKGKTLTLDELTRILSNHAKWLRLTEDERSRKENGNLWANLCGATLKDTNLAGSDFREADLTRVKFAEFSNLEGANFEHATLNNAQLVRVYLDNADLRSSSFWQTKLLGTTLYGAQLSGSYFDVNIESLPDIVSLEFVPDLRDVAFALPDALTAIRQQFKQRGNKDKEAELTYAIKRGENSLLGWPARWVRWIAFDLTYNYGLRPARALWWLLLFVFGFSPAYVFAQILPVNSGGIWAVWPKDRIVAESGRDDPLKLTNGFPRDSPKDASTENQGRKLSSVLGLSLYFSLLSAFRIGWHEFNVGTWFSRLQPGEYNLRATGWVRSVSGLQSLLSVYLFALWLVAMFGTSPD